MKRIAISLLVVLTACSSAPLTSSESDAQPLDVSHARSSSPARSGGTFMPDPDRHVPGRAKRLVPEIERVHRALRASVDEWLESGDIMERKPPRAVLLQGLYQQRIFRKLGSEGRLARRTIDLLGKRLGRIVRAHRRASVGLRKLTTPRENTDGIKTGRSAAAGLLLEFFKEGQRKFGVDWEILAAVNFIETKFNKIRSSSSAGAQGPMQFMPATWEQYGMGGNIYGNHDSIMGAANYLRASGAPRDYRSALYAYNHSDAYVNAVLVYAHRIMHDPRWYFQYYNWQIFIVTKDGDVRMTGPGL
jgi:hypothetical protein